MIMANAYDAFASAYDALNSDADYTAMADHIDKVFARSNIPRSSLVLDLGCGTGMLTRELDARGYDMTGVDSSEEMLGKAYENSAQSGKILYLCQDITEFELYGTVAAAVCTTDTLNHLTDDESVAKVDSDGIVTATGRGSARVTVTYINETTGKELEYLYDVTVTFTRWQWIIWYLFFGFLWY